MKALRNIFLILLALPLWCACSTAGDEPKPPVVDPAPGSDNVYFENNKWIYAQMNRHYLWREDLPDSTACDYELAPNLFFESLLSPKDRFSYMLNNPYYSPTQRNNPGFAWQTYRDSRGEEAQLVLYVASEEARRAGIRRGDWIRILDQSDALLTFKRITLSADNTFLSAKDGAVQAISVGQPQSTVLFETIYDSKIGYICYTEFDSTEDLFPTLLKFYNQGIEELIVDLRYNPGGYVSTCRYFCNCIAPSAAYGNIYQITRYNDIISSVNIAETGRPELYNNFGYAAQNFDKYKDTPVVGLQMKRVFVLTSKNTASASEALIICLRPYMEVIQIGETTVGKGVGSYTLYDREFRYAIQPITMQYYNARGVTVENSGLTPQVYVPDGYSTSKSRIGDIDEPLLNAALSIIDPAYASQPAARPASDAQPALTPVGEPSYVKEFKYKQHNESDF